MAKEEENEIVESSEGVDNGDNGESGEGGGESEVGLDEIVESPDFNVGGFDDAPVGLILHSDEAMPSRAVRGLDEDLKSVEDINQEDSEAENVNYGLEENFYEERERRRREREQEGSPVQVMDFSQNRVERADLDAHQVSWDDRRDVGMVQHMNISGENDEKYEVGRVEESKPGDAGSLKDDLKKYESRR